MGAAPATHHHYQQLPLLLLLLLRLLQAVLEVLRPAALS
jgi:hypothetical protein